MVVVVVTLFLTRGAMTMTPNPAFERTRGSGRGSAMNCGARAAQRERWASGAAVLCKRKHDGSVEKATLLLACPGDSLLATSFVVLRMRNDPHCHEG